MFSFFFLLLGKCNNFGNCKITESKEGNYERILVSSLTKNGCNRRAFVHQRPTKTLKIVQYRFMLTLQSC